MRNLYEFFKITSMKFSDHILFDRKITYNEAFRLARQRAVFLQKNGVKKGDVVALLGPNSYEWCITYMAITMNGSIVLALDGALPDSDYPKMLKAVKCRYAFTTADKRRVLKGCKVWDLSLENAVVKNGDFKEPKLTERDIASYSFTSGTTGTPKIVILTHGNIFKTALHSSAYLGLTPRDSFLCILPLFHAYALSANFICPFAQGSSFTFLRSLKGADILRALAENSFTVFPAAPQLWELFMDGILEKAKNASAAKHMLLLFFLNATPVFRFFGFGFIPNAVFKPIRNVFGSSMRILISGGAPFKAKYFRYYNNIGIPLIQGYGLTETNGPIALSHPDDNRPGSVGPIMQVNDFRIKRINADGVGEIWLKGDAVTPGYYKNPKLNRQVFDADGFFNTGDLGRADRDGHIFLTGRHKNVIVLDSGKNVYPDEIEAYYRKSRFISEISVFARKVNGRECAWAVIVPRRKSADSFLMIKKEIARLGSGLPTYKVISGFSLSYDPLPKNSTRKVLVHEVKAALEKGVYQSSESGSAQKISEFIPENTTEEQAAALFRKKYKLEKIVANELLSDVGIDSLGLIDCASYYEEQMGVRVDMKKLPELNTVEELIKLVAASPKVEGASIDDEILHGELKYKPWNVWNPVIDCAIVFIGFVARHFWKLRMLNRAMHDYRNAIIVANHQSNLDIVVFLSMLTSRERRSIYFVGKKELSFVRFLFPGINALFVDRSGDVLPSLKAGADLLRQGKSLMIFPEGTRSMDGSLARFKSGAAYLSKNLNIRICPMAINGTIDYMPKGKIMPKFSGGSGITIIAMKMINPENYGSIQAINRDMIKEIETEIDVRKTGEPADSAAEKKKTVKKAKPVMKKTLPQKRKIKPAAKKSAPKAKKAVKKTARKSTKPVSRKAALNKKNVRTKTPAKKVVKKTAQKPVKRAFKKIVKKPVRRPVKKTLKKSVKKPDRKTAARKAVSKARTSHISLKKKVKGTPVRALSKKTALKKKGSIIRKNRKR